MRADTYTHLPFSTAAKPSRTVEQRLSVDELAELFPEEEDLIEELGGEQARESSMALRIEVVFIGFLSWRP